MKVSLLRSGGSLRRHFFWVLVGIVVAVSLWRLEAERHSVDLAVLDTPEGEVSYYHPKTGETGPLVLVTHGFAGSRQMMQYISRDLARAGFRVAAFDFYGHGRNSNLLSRDVSRIEGTTHQLVEQTKAILMALQTAGIDTDRVAVLGHSMATDIIIRAARDLSGVGAVVAISMYSEAVTPDFPERLLVISGAWEARLREVGGDVVAQVGGAALEGQTVMQGDVVRRAVYIPNTEHVAVLFATKTLEEARAWLQQAFDLVPQGRTIPQGPVILVLMVGLVLLGARVMHLLPQSASTVPRVTMKTYFLALLAPVLPACAAAVILGGDLFGLASFRSLLWFFGVWGSVALLVLMRSGQRMCRPDWPGTAVFLVFGFGVFALALDRYAAAFLPVGPRAGLMAVLAIGCIPFMVADRMLVHGAALWQRLVARVVPVLALGSCMMLYPEKLGLLFTVLPVLVLFYLVYGTMGHLLSRRQGAETAGLALGVVLAWSIAASTPLFAG
jgi:pimeloyl-ACP methyl ester carboxylesterase